MYLKMRKPELSIVILSYNAKNLLRECLNSLREVGDEASFEVVVVDNASSDGSALMVKGLFPWVKVIQNDKNLGFAAGNNTARNICKGDFILFLNSDTLVYKSTLAKTIKYLKSHEDVGVVTCKMELPGGRGLDKDARRSFITPWIGLTHIFLRLDRLFPSSKLFAKYWYGYIPDNAVHEIDVAQGAFFLTRRKLLDKLGWFDEDYFLDGEDIDLCWRIKDAGWRIIYYPEAAILHYKGFSKGKVESVSRNKVSLAEKLKYRMSGVDSMQKFYTKRLWNRYPLFLNLFVLMGIYALKIIRFTRTILLG
jgi:hypothetical protein